MEVGLSMNLLPPWLASIDYKSTRNDGPEIAYKQTLAMI